MNFIEKTFTIPVVPGISEKAFAEHLKLYAGYVKHANLIAAELAKQSSAPEDLTPEHVYARNEMRRRFAFEFDGIRNHEYFFAQFEGGATGLAADSALALKINEAWGSFESWKSDFTATALTRGIGWAILYYDQKTNQLINAWVDEQHIGHLTGLDVIVAFDIWEHAYLFDYIPAQKKEYVEALFNSLNWTVAEKRYLA